MKTPTKEGPLLQNISVSIIQLSVKIKVKRIYLLEKLLHITIKNTFLIIIEVVHLLINFEWYKKEKEKKA